MIRHQFTGLMCWSMLSVSLTAVGCNREPATEVRQDAAAPGARADNDSRQQNHAADIARLNERIAGIEKKYTEKNQNVSSGARTATTGLREEVKEDVTNVKRAAQELGSTTPENWWERHEHAMARTADDIEADVRRIAGLKAVNVPAAPTGTTGTANSATAAFTSRRDAFVKSLGARVDAMQQALENVKASGARETEVSDTRARLDKLEDDINTLRSASADEWWDLSKGRVTEYVDRVEQSVDRLDDDKPAR